MSPFHPAFGSRKFCHRYIGKGGFSWTTERATHRAYSGAIVLGWRANPGRCGLKPQDDPAPPGSARPRRDRHIRNVCTVLERADFQVLHPPVHLKQHVLKAAGRPDAQ